VKQYQFRDAVDAAIRRRRGCAIAGMIRGSRPVRPAEVGA